MVQKKAKEIKLHLGCGKRNIPGFINIDHSQAYFPHMHKKTGIMISLNIDEKKK